MAMFSANRQVRIDRGWARQRYLRFGVQGQKYPELKILRVEEDVAPVRQELVWVSHHHSQRNQAAAGSKPPQYTQHQWGCLLKVEESQTTHPLPLSRSHGMRPPPCPQKPRHLNHALQNSINSQTNPAGITLSIRVEHSPQRFEARQHTHQWLRRSETGRFRPRQKIEKTFYSKSGNYVVQGAWTSVGN